MGNENTGGFNWANLVALWLQQRAADKAADQKPQYTISPQMQQLFDKLMGLINYSPTRDYVSSYADSFIKSQNAPGGALSWKPEFKSEYMQGQPPLPNTGLDLSKLPIFQGDKLGKMPWNAGYTGPGIGGKPTGSGVKPKFTPGSGPVPSGGGRAGGYGGVGAPFMQTAPPEGGGWSDDYYNNPYNPLVGGGLGNDPWNVVGGGDGPRDQYGQLITNMNSTNFTDVVKPNADGTVSLYFPGMPKPSTLTAEQWQRLQANEAAFKKFMTEQAEKIKQYAATNKIDIFKAAVMLFMGL